MGVKQTTYRNVQFSFFHYQSASVGCRLNAVCVCVCRCKPKKQKTVWFPILKKIITKIRKKTSVFLRLKHVASLRLFHHLKIVEACA